jgi:hypothetical protein
MVVPFYSKLHHTKPTASNHGRGGSGKGRKVWACEVDGVEYVLTRKGDIALFASKYLRSDEAQGRTPGAHQAGFEKWLKKEILDALELRYEVYARELERVLNTHKFL